MRRIVKKWKSYRRKKSWSEKRLGERRGRYPERKSPQTTYSGTPVYKPPNRFLSWFEGAFGIFIIGIIILFFVSSFGLPFFLGGIGVGNPKAVYIYDADPSCSANVDRSLNDLSDQTGVKFIKVPFAGILGGIGYSCNGYLENYGASGEAESGYIGGGYIIIAWNQVRLIDTHKDTIIHETLHVMGFKHTNDPSSIMYPVSDGSPYIEPEIIDFIKSWYVNNPLAYLNIITFNMIYAVLGVMFGIMIIGVALTDKK